MGNRKRIGRLMHQESDSMSSRGRGISCAGQEISQGGDGIDCRYGYIANPMETGLTLVCLRCGHSWLRRSLAKIPGNCPRKGEAAPRTKLQARPKAPEPRPLTRSQGLQVAADVIHALQGYRKNVDYRTMQNDLNFVCEVLQRASAGETNSIARPRE